MDVVVVVVFELVVLVVVVVLLVVVDVAVAVVFVAEVVVVVVDVVVVEVTVTVVDVAVDDEEVVVVDVVDVVDVLSSRRCRERACLFCTEVIRRSWDFLRCSESYAWSQETGCTRGLFASLRSVHVVFIREDFSRRETAYCRLQNPAREENVHPSAALRLVADWDSERWRRRRPSAKKVGRAQLERRGWGSHRW